MNSERMELDGIDRFRYFVPTAICVSLGALCAALILTSAFLANLQDAVAVSAAGAFGLLLSGGLGCLFWLAQRRDLLYMPVITTSDAPSNFAAVRSAALRAGWLILREYPDRQLDAQTPLSLLDVGERVQVLFRQGDVLVASICDPSVGFSLAGRRHCAEHRELVRQAVLPQGSGD
jgi:hypothetical protein